MTIFILDVKGKYIDPLCFLIDFLMNDGSNLVDNTIEVLVHVEFHEPYKPFKFSFKIHRLFYLIVWYGNVFIW